MIPPAGRPTPVRPSDPTWHPPPLPRRLTDPVPVILVGSTAWALAAAVLGVLAATGTRPLDVWFPACLVGVGLGVVGLLVLGLQRRAARRGSRGAQVLDG